LQRFKPRGRVILPVRLEGAQQILLIKKSNAGRITTQEILPAPFSLFTSPI